LENKTILKDTVKKKFRVFLKKDESNPIIISGVTRSGKAMLMQIVSSMNNVEKSTMNILMEQVYYLHQIKMISFDVANLLLRRSYNVLSSNLIHGRELNFKKDDYTSFYNYKNPMLYIERSKKEIDKEKTKKIKKKIYIPLMLHFASPSYRMLIEAFPNCKIIDMVKNPVEIAYSWIKKGYGENWCKDPNYSVLSLNDKNKYVPYYAYKWENKYLSLNKYDRVVASIEYFEKKRNIEIKKLNKNLLKKIHVINFDEFVFNTKKSLKNLENFLKLKKSNFTKKVLSREKCPREKNIAQLQSKRDFIKKKLTKKYYSKILIMEKKFLRT